MKLTTVLLIVTMMQVSAATFAQNITLKKQNVSLDQLFKEIRKQTGYAVIWSGIKIKETKNINANFDNTPLEQVLSTTLKTQKLNYEIYNKNIIVTRYKQNSFENIGARFQEIDVRGKVVDQNNKPLPGATIKIKGGAGQVTTSGSNGTFYLKNIEENATIEISFIGYLTKEVNANADLSNIVLEFSNSKLDEVVVQAYGTISQRFSTSNIGTIKGEDIAKQPVANPLLAIQGRVPGLFIRQGSGVNGSPVNVNLQGINSLNSGNEPFYVVDGVPYLSQFSRSLMGDAVTGTQGSTFNFISPADIESVTILKDADATAIYGSRAANGAILITSKKGKIGKTKVDLNLQNGWGKMTRRLNLMNTTQYLEMRREAYVNAGEEIPNRSSIQDPSNYDLTLWDKNRYTDWQKELVGGTAAYTDLQASVSGGNINTRFLGGYGYHRETTVYPGDLSDVKGNFHFNLDHNSTDNRFKYLLSGTFVQDKNKLNNADLMGEAIKLAPNAPNLKNDDGSLNWAYVPGTTSSTFENPLRHTLQQFTGNTSNLIANNTVSYEFTTDFILKTNFGYNKLESDETKLRPLAFFDPSLPGRTREAGYINKSITSWIIEPQATYTRTTKFGTFDGLLGTTFQQTKSDFIQQTGTGFATDAQLGDLSSATTKTVNSVMKTLYKYTAAFGRLNYRLDDKYILNFTARRDGSSRFGDENKFNNFYSVGGAWLFGSEGFIRQNVPWLSFGKLRANYGTTGNDQIKDYSYLSLLSNYNPANIPYQQSPSLYPTNISNPLLQWEETKKLNLGMDLGFLNDRILLNLNYSRNTSSNQLLGYALPLMTGFESVYANFPATIQNIGFEAELSVTPLKTKNLKWNSSLNLTIPKNKLIEFPGLENSSYANTYVIGMPVNIQKQFEFRGVDPATGLYQFVSSKGGLTSSPDYSTDFTGIIDLNPKYYGGWSNSITYKDFQLNFLFQFVKQIGQNYRYGNFAGFFNLNQPINVINRWRKAGDAANNQKVSNGFDIYDPLFGLISSDANYSDASYIRLKNVSLSYSLPSGLLQKAGISNARFYVQGQNLLTITKYDGSDPETQYAGNIPPLRTITLGLQFTF